MEAGESSGQGGGPLGGSPETPAGRASSECPSGRSGGWIRRPIGWALTARGPRLCHLAGALLLGLVVVTAGGPSLADEAPPPPTSVCPSGSEPAKRYPGPRCVPTVCELGEPCAAGQVCEPNIGLCVETTEVPCRGGDEDEPCTRTIETVHAACHAGGSCEVGTCVLAPRCVAETSALFIIVLFGILSGLLLIMLVVRIRSGHDRSIDPS